MKRNKNACAHPMSWDENSCILKEWFNWSRKILASIKLLSNCLFKSSASQQITHNLNEYTELNAYETINNSNWIILNISFKWSGALSFVGYFFLSWHTFKVPHRFPSFIMKCLQCDITKVREGKCYLKSF